MNEGKKYDDGKPMMRLVPPKALESTARVLTFGAGKYGPDNWRKVEGARDRYIDAALRHINAYLQGEETDPESGLPHLSHALCSLLFVNELDLDRPVKTMTYSIDKEEIESAVNAIAENFKQFDEEKRIKAERCKSIKEEDAWWGEISKGRTERLEVNELKGTFKSDFEKSLAQMVDNKRKQYEGKPWPMYHLETQHYALGTPFLDTNALAADLQDGKYNYKIENKDMVVTLKQGNTHITLRRPIHGE